MGSSKNILEPACTLPRQKLLENTRAYLELTGVAIALIFACGAILNRRPQQRSWAHDVSEIEALYPNDPEFKRNLDCFPMPDNSRFRYNITSRLLARFPFLLEIWYWNLTYWVYQLARAFSARLISDSESAFELAKSHAFTILSIESHLHIDREASFQQCILQHVPWLQVLLARIYYSHIIVGVVFIVYTYTYLPSPLFQSIRRTIAVDNLIAFVILTCWRCMPPRLLPPEFGFVDVLHEGSQSAWQNNSFQLTIAAMPSLHFGTSLFIALCLWRWAPHRWLRTLAPFWPAAMFITIIGTANHFVLDALVGAMVPALGWRINEMLLVLRPLEGWAFWAFRTERPREVDAEESFKAECDAKSP